MGEKVFLIQMHGPKQLQLSWRFGWRDVKVKLGEELIGVIEKRSELIKGRSFPLPDGSSLKVQLDQTLKSAGLAVFHNDKPLHGSAADPVTRYQAAYGSLYVIGVGNILGGLLSYFLKIALFQVIGFSWLSIITGVGLFLLGFWVRKGSTPALITGIVLYALDGIGSSIMTILWSRSQGTLNIGILSIFVHLVFLILMFQGISALIEIKGTDRTADER